jgi:hypothetical protein
MKTSKMFGIRVPDKMKTRKTTNTMASALLIKRKQEIQEILWHPHSNCNRNADANY